MLRNASKTTGSFDLFDITLITLYGPEDKHKTCLDPEKIIGDQFDMDYRHGMRFLES